MSELSDYRRLCSDPLEERLRATVRDQAAKIAALAGALQPFAAYYPAIMAMGGNYPKTGVLISIESAVVGLRELTVEDFARAGDVMAPLSGGVGTTQANDTANTSQSQEPAKHNCLNPNTSGTPQ